MPAVWSSRHKLVLEWWADVQERDKAYREVCEQIEKETGRAIVLRTGFGDEWPMGLSKHSYNEDPPEGWKLGWGKRDSGFFEPRARGKGSSEAIATMKRVQDVYVRVRHEAHERFGVPEFQMFGLHAISPGFELLNGRLYVTFGEYDFDPDDDHKITTFFSPSRLSNYHRAKEKAAEEVA